MDLEVEIQDLSVVRDTDVGTVGEKTMTAFGEQLMGTNDEFSEDTEAKAVEKSADEAMYIDDIFMYIPAEVRLPSAGVKITKIIFGGTIHIPGVDKWSWYKASIPKIPEDDKGKELLIEKDPVKGNPVEEQVVLVKAEIALLVELREFLKRQYDDTIPSVSEFFRMIKKRWADVCLEVVAFCSLRRLLPVGSVNFCRGLPVGEPVFRVAPRQSPVFAHRVSQFCSVFIDFSLFSWLPTADITDFLSSIALDRTTFRDVQIAHNTVSVAPSVQMIAEPSSSESSSHDISMDFVDTAAAAPTPNITDALNQLRASIDQICERDEGAKLRDILSLHLSNFESKVIARLDAQDKISVCMFEFCVFGSISILRVILEIFVILGLEVSAGDSFDDVMLCVGIVVADVIFAAGSLARCVLCFGSWRQQRLRGFQQESVIEFRSGVVLMNQSMTLLSSVDGCIALIVCLLVVNAGQPSCSARRIRRRLVSARSFSRFLVLCKVLLLVFLTSAERRRLSKWQRRVLMLLLVSAGGSALRCFVYCCWMTSSCRGSLMVENASTIAPAGFVGGNALLLVAAIPVDSGRCFGHLRYRWTPLEELFHPIPFVEAVVSWNKSTKLLFVFVRFEVAGFYQSLRDFSQCYCCSVQGTDLSFYYSEIMAWMNGRAAIPHSHLPAGIVATMRRVVNYHSSWARQQQVELFDASVISVVLLLSVLGFDPMSLRGLVCFFVALFSGNPGSTAGRGFNPAGGAPGGG
ncbi:hypothetical protein F511_22609 [Dorcoceras hygrometricum]|uniref:Uncharacterized protein n=1 Tax=Dorcoceras hygrometricum TaxID=472368 RepID=A0A2Z7CAQ5_9LAMI|nr:hypothetical protein F511_22609 [Dorcoceras hygrometricum]